MTRFLLKFKMSDLFEELEQFEKKIDLHAKKSSSPVLSMEQ